jgi:antitoxin ParD1/3/4
MPKHTSFSLGEHFEGFIAQEVDSGSYASASEVVRDGLRLLEHRKKRLAMLRAAIEEAWNSPESEDLDGTQAFARLRKKHGLASRRG